MNHTVFAKTMKTVRNRVDARFVNNAKKYQELAYRTIFVPQKIFSKNIILVTKTKKVLTLDKRVDVGTSIFELSKVLIYKFHYNCIKKEYSDKANLPFTDTRSLIYDIKTDDL